MGNNTDMIEAAEGGMLLGMSRSRRLIYVGTEDNHSLIIGTTRCGKTRSLILPSIGITALAGESMVVVDPKGENFAYTAHFLARLGYEVITLDFIHPRRSSHYNFLQPCIDAHNMGDIPRVVTAARDIAAILIPDSKQEPVWTDGARSTLTMAILAVVMENSDRPEYQNLANAHQFIANMCRPLGRFGKTALQAYLDERPEDHPLKIAMAVANIAPAKMRGSFYTQALVAIETLTDPLIHSMTADTDFDIEATGRRKRALFLIVPDQKKTYHPLAALFVQQHYQTMVEVANHRGGRLEQRVEFFCDEFGNFVRLPDFDTALTVSGGRGIRWHIVLQAFSQLDEKYGSNIAKTIRSNCELWIYLRSEDPDTHRMISERLGKYTIKAPSVSGSSTGQGTASYSYTGRPLLMPEELGRLQRPWQLVMSRAAPAIMYAPDISRTIFNRLFGMGGKNHNTELVKQRLLLQRPERDVQTSYWGVWTAYINEILLEDAMANS